MITIFKISTSTKIESFQTDHFLMLVALVLRARTSNARRIFPVLLHEI